MSGADVVSRPFGGSCLLLLEAPLPEAKGRFDHTGSSNICDQTLLDRLGEDIDGQVARPQACKLQRKYTGT